MPGRDRSGPRGGGAATGRGLGGCVTGGVAYGYGRRVGGGGRFGVGLGRGRGLGAVYMPDQPEVDVDKQNLMNRLEELEAEVRSLRGNDKNSGD